MSSDLTNKELEMLQGIIQKMLDGEDGIVTVDYIAEDYLIRFSLCRPESVSEEGVKEQQVYVDLNAGMVDSSLKDGMYKHLMVTVADHLVKAKRLYDETQPLPSTQS